MTEVNFLDQFFYWPTPGGMGYQLCYIGVRHAHGWYRCFSKNGMYSFFLHEQDLAKVDPKPAEYFKVLETTPETQIMLNKMDDQKSIDN